MSECGSDGGDFEDDAAIDVGGEGAAWEGGSELSGVEGLAEAGEIEECESLIEGVNPGFDPFDMESPYSNNCGSCAIATELRLSGEDAEAVAGVDCIDTPEEMNAVTGLEQTAMTPDQIVEYAQGQGPGWHAICGYDRADLPDGHWVNLHVGESGRLYVLDSQCGRVAPFNEFIARDPGVNYDVSLKKEDDGGTD